MTEERSWNVITAGPSAGKTSTLRALSAKGYWTVPESARLVIDQKVSEGYEPDEIREALPFQEMLESKDREMEESVVPDTGVVFFDRSAADNIAYRRHYGTEVPGDLIEFCTGRYSNVFLLEQLPFEDDYARNEDEEEAKEIHAELRRTYERLGYEVVEVPLIPVDERVEFIENRMVFERGSP